MPVTNGIGHTAERQLFPCFGNGSVANSNAGEPVLAGTGYKREARLERRLTIENMKIIDVPAGHGRAFYVGKGTQFRITTPKGQQSADFFAFGADNINVCLSPHHTWMPTRSLHPRVGDTFISREREPMVDFVEDGADGLHDFIIAPCDAIRYEQFGVPGHRSCIGNLEEAMAELGSGIPSGPLAVNFFTNTTVDNGFTFRTPSAAVVKPGGYVVLESRMDLICAVSSCPYDLEGPGWAINAPSGPTEIVVELL